MVLALVYSLWLYVAQGTQMFLRFLDPYEILKHKWVLRNCGIYKTIISEIYLFSYVYFSIIHSNQDRETTWMSMNRWKDQEKEYPQYAHIHNGMLFSIKKKETCNNMVGPGGH